PSLIPFDMVTMPTGVMSNFKTISDKRIPQLLAQAGLTVILLSSPWDGNGIIMRSIVEGIAGQYPNVTFCQANYEDTPQLARLFNLLNPPGLLLVRDGELVHRITKPMSAGNIQELIQANA
ncbi:MAG: thioredoxin family protein, partial [Bacteroidota bacterium]